MNTWSKIYPSPTRRQAAGGNGQVLKYISHQNALIISLGKTV